MLKLEPPLANLISRCQTICVPECCGVDAYDFSPIQIASYLTMHRGSPDDLEVQTLRSQINEIRKNYGLSGAIENGTSIEGMNQNFSAEQIESFAEELLTNIDVALNQIEKSEALRFRSKPE